MVFYGFCCSKNCGPGSLTSIGNGELVNHEEEIMTFKQELIEAGVNLKDISVYNNKEEARSEFDVVTKNHLYAGTVYAKHPWMPPGYKYMVYVTQDVSDYHECPQMLHPVKTLDEAKKRIALWIWNADQNF